MIVIVDRKYQRGVLRKLCLELFRGLQEVALLLPKWIVDGCFGQDLAIPLASMWQVLYEFEGELIDHFYGDNRGSRSGDLGHSSYFCVHFVPVFHFASITWCRLR